MGWGRGGGTHTPARRTDGARRLLLPRSHQIVLPAMSVGVCVWRVESRKARRVCVNESRRALPSARPRPLASVSLCPPYTQTRARTHYAQRALAALTQKLVEVDAHKAGAPGVERVERRRRAAQEEREREELGEPELPAARRVEALEHDLQRGAVEAVACARGWGCVWGGGRAREGGGA